MRGGGYNKKKKKDEVLQEQALKVAIFEVKGKGGCSHWNWYKLGKKKKRLIPGKKMKIRIMKSY